MSAAYISEDGGRNWRHDSSRAASQRHRLPPPAFHPTDPNIIYASSGGRLKISRDRGKTFVPIGNLKDSLGGRDRDQPFGPERIAGGFNERPLLAFARWRGGVVSLFGADGHG